MKEGNKPKLGSGASLLTPPCPWFTLLPAKSFSLVSNWHKTGWSRSLFFVPFCCILPQYQNCRWDKVYWCGVGSKIAIEESNLRTEKVIEGAMVSLSTPARLEQEQEERGYNGEEKQQRQGQGAPCTSRSDPTISFTVVHAVCGLLFLYNIVAGCTHVVVSAVELILVVLLPCCRIAFVVSFCIPFPCKTNITRHEDSRTYFSFTFPRCKQK